MKEFADFSLTDIEDHSTHDHEIDQDSTWTTFSEGRTRTNKETSTNRSSDGDHVKMARLHGLVQTLNTAALTFERVGRASHAGPEALTLMCLSVDDVVGIIFRRVDSDVLFSRIVLGWYSGRHCEERPERNDCLKEEVNGIGKKATEVCDPEGD